MSSPLASFEIVARDSRTAVAPVRRGDSEYAASRRSDNPEVRIPKETLQHHLDRTRLRTVQRQQRTRHWRGLAVEHPAAERTGKFDKGRKNSLNVIGPHERYSVRDDFRRDPFRVAAP